MRQFMLYIIAATMLVGCASMQQTSTSSTGELQERNSEKVAQWDGWIKRNMW